MELQGVISCSQEPAALPVLSHLILVHNLNQYKFNVHFNIILSNTPTSPKWFPPFRHPD
jgi:hypothetical protein